MIGLYQIAQKLNLLSPSSNKTNLIQLLKCGGRIKYNFISIQLDTETVGSTCIQIKY